MKESVLEINANHLKHNFQWYKSQTTSGFICPMIKANAYGAGAEEIFKILRSDGADTVGVVRLVEAEKIRGLDQDVDILMFNPCDKESFRKALKLNVTPVISSLQCLADLSAVLVDSPGQCVSIHLEFDTGMNRLGFKTHQLEDLMRVLNLQTQIQVAGIFSHLVQADDWPAPTGRSSQQLKDFQVLCSRFKSFLESQPNLQTDHALKCHFSSSKALNDLAQLASNKTDLIQYGFRPGLGLYGISQNNQKLKTVLTLKSPIVDVKWIAEGETVSYDGAWTAHRDSLIATLPLGYGDGFPRSLMGKTHVGIEGLKAPVVGKICMDFIMVDLTDLALASKGDDLSSFTASDLKRAYKATELQAWLSKVAVVFGDRTLDEDLTVESLSEKSGFITYEFLVRLSSRLRRKVVEL